MRYRVRRFSAEEMQDSSQPITAQQQPPQEEKSWYRKKCEEGREKHRKMTGLSLFM